MEHKHIFYYQVKLSYAATEQAVLTASDKASSDYFGWSAAISVDGLRAIVGAPYADRSSVYVFLRTGVSWAQEAKLVASDAAAQDRFGLSVSMTSDATRVVIGSYKADPGGVADAGAAYVFLRTGTTWTQEAIITASDKVADDYFGYLVAINTDASRVIISAPNANPSGIADAGKAYIFLRTGTTWTQEAILTASDKASGDNFGWSGAVTSDGSRVIIGAYQANVSSIADAGKAYIFLRTGTTWTQEAILIATDASDSSMLGYSVSICSNGTRAIAGAHYTTGANNYRGAAYIFSRSGTTWTQEAKLTPADPYDYDYFGKTVLMSSDGDKVIISAPGKDIIGSTTVMNVGCVYIFTRSGTTWDQNNKILSSTPSTTTGATSSGGFGSSIATTSNMAFLIIGECRSDPSGVTDAGSVSVFAPGWTYGEQAILTASDKAQNDYLGNSVYMSPDSLRVIICSTASDPSGMSSAGAAYVFLRTGTSWAQEAKLTASDKAAGAQFGISASCDSTCTRIVIGAYQSTQSGLTAAGAAYVFLRTGTSWTEEAKLLASDKAASDSFGYAVTMNSDSTRIAIGATGVNSLTGAVYIFLRTGTSWTQEAKIIASDGAASDCFGYFISLDSTATRILVGSRMADPSGVSDAGAAYVFLRTGTSWAQETKLTASDKASNSYLGGSICLSSDGTRAIAGAQYKIETLGGGDGAVYIFLRTGSSWVQEAKLVDASPSANERFGYSVSINAAGTKAIVSAYNRAVGGQTSIGTVYVFTRSGTTWTQEAKLMASVPESPDNFGVSVSTDTSGGVIAIGCWGKTVAGVPNSGAAYIFSY